MRFAWYSMMALLTIGVLLHLFPFYYMISLSFTSAEEALSPTPVLIPQEPTTAAWKLAYTITSQDAQNMFQSNARAAALLKHPFSVYLKNSLIMAFGTLALSLPVTSLSAYAVSKLVKGRKSHWLFLFFIGTLMVPGVITLIPTFFLTRNFPFSMPNPPMIPGTETEFPVIRTWNTLWALIIPGVFNAFNFLMFKGFFDTIPDSVIQAARVDGGSEFNIFRRIILPMSIPVFAVCAWLQFSSVWESYLWPLVVIQDSAKQPVTVAIADLVQAFTRSSSTNAEAANNLATNPRLREIMESGLSWNGLMVLGLIQTTPIFIMFIICREYLMKGIRLRGLK
jgi:ABC-type glycerol-3-phosphate transport system permease component